MVQAKEKLSKARKKREKELRDKLNLLKKKQKFKNRKKSYQLLKMNQKARTEGFMHEKIHQKRLKSPVIKVETNTNFKKGTNISLGTDEVFDKESHKRLSNLNLMDQIKNSTMKKISSNYILLKFRNELNYGRPEGNKRQNY